MQPTLDPTLDPMQYCDCLHQREPLGFKGSPKEQVGSDIPKRENVEVPHRALEGGDKIRDELMARLILQLPFMFSFTLS